MQLFGRLRPQTQAAGYRLLIRVWVQNNYINYRTTEITDLPAETGSVVGKFNYTQLHGRESEMGKRQRKAKDGYVGEVKCGRQTRDGTPCKNAPINGTNVCRMHGGAAPQVRRKAEERIEAAAYPAAVVMTELLGSDEESMRYKASADLMNRNGLGNKQEITLHVPLWQQGLGDILVDYDVGEPETETEAYPESHSSTAREPLPLDPSDPTPPGYGSRHA